MRPLGPECRNAECTDKRRRAIRAVRTQDSQKRNGLSVSSQRKSLGRKLLSENAERQTEEIQRLCQDERRMRASACRNDSREESGDRS